MICEPQKISTFHDEAQKILEALFLETAISRPYVQEALCIDYTFLKHKIFNNLECSSLYAVNLLCLVQPILRVYLYL
jgi:hypothetical protein